MIKSWGFMYVIFFALVSYVKNRCGYDIKDGDVPNIGSCVVGM